MDHGLSLIETYGSDTVTINEAAFKGIVQFMSTFDPHTDIINSESFAEHDLTVYVETRKVIGNQSIIIIHNSSQYDQACNPLRVSATLNPLDGSINTTSVSAIRLYNIRKADESRNTILLAQNLGTEIAQQSSTHSTPVGPRIILEEALHNGIGHAVAAIDRFYSRNTSREDAYLAYVQQRFRKVFQLYYMEKPVEFGVLTPDAFYRLMDNMGDPLILDWSGPDEEGSYTNPDDNPMVLWWNR